MCGTISFIYDIYVCSSPVYPYQGTKETSPNSLEVNVSALVVENWDLLHYHIKVTMLISYRFCWHTS